MPGSHPRGLGTSWEQDTQTHLSFANHQLLGVGQEFLSKPSVGRLAYLLPQSAGSGVQVLVGNRGQPHCAQGGSTGNIETKEALGNYSLKLHCSSTQYKNVFHLIFSHPPVPQEIFNECWQILSIV